MKKNEILKSILAWAIVLILLGLAFVIYRDTVTDVINGIRSMDRSTILFCCLIAMIYYLCEGTIMFRMGRLINQNYKWHKGFSLSLICEFFRVLTMGTGSGFAEILFLQKDGIPAGKGSGLTLMQYGFKRFTMVIMCLASFIFLSLKPETSGIMNDHKVLVISAILFSFFVSFLVTGLAFSIKLNRLMNFILDKLKEKFSKKTDLFEKWRKTVNQLNEAGQTYIHYPTLLVEVFILNVIKMSAFYFIPAFILGSSSDVSLLDCTLLMSVAFVSATLIPAPSGVGALEFAFVMFFEGLVIQAHAITGVLVYRFCTWIVPCVIGFVIWIFSKIINKESKSA